MKRFAPAGLLVAVLCACATQPVVYAPAAAPVERLPTAKLPKLLIEEVSDASSPGDLRLGEMTGATMTDGSLDPKIDWTETLRQALVLELQRLGWPMTENRAFSGPRLKPTVVSVHAEDSRMGHVDAKMTIGLALKDSDGRTVWEGRLEGSGTGTAWATVRGGFREGLNAALNAAIPRLGPLLADERPWELLGKRSAAPVTSSLEPAPAAPDSGVDELPAARAANPHSYAVVIGVEHYREKLPDAEFAASDADLTAKYIERAFGVPQANVALLTDGRATKSDFEKYFENWLPNHVEAGDTVYVYYSGHGAPNPAKGDAYLVPYDGDPTYIETTGYSVKRLFDQLAKLPAKRVYVAMDSCFSGAGGRSVIAKGSRPLVSVVQADVPARLTVLAASAGDQISNTYQEKGHGLFTYFFLKGIKEKGGDFRAVFNYLKPEVTRVARRDDNADQVPQWRQGR